MIEICERYVPKTYHAINPHHIVTHQDNHTRWEKELRGQSVPEQVKIDMKIGGIDALLRKLVEFSCECDLEIRITDNSYTMTGSINVYRVNTIGIVQHILREMDLLVFSIAHEFGGKKTVRFHCKQTITFGAKQ